jgi:hypothetical protein
LFYVSKCNAFCLFEIMYIRYYKVKQIMQFLALYGPQFSVYWGVTISGGRLQSWTYECLVLFWVLAVRILLTWHRLFTAECHQNWNRSDVFEMSWDFTLLLLILGSNVTNDEILQNHFSLLITFNTSKNQNQFELPHFYWIPKLHKILTKIHCWFQ